MTFDYHSTATGSASSDTKLEFAKDLPQVFTIFAKNVVIGAIFCCCRTLGPSKDM